MLKAIAGFWLAFNLLWLAGLFFLITLKGSVIISEPRAWLAGLELFLSLTTLAALVIVYNSNRD